MSILPPCPPTTPSPLILHYLPPCPRLPRTFAVEEFDEEREAVADPDSFVDIPTTIITITESNSVLLMRQYQRDWRRVRRMCYERRREKLEYRKNSY